jgi:hypothetical protein
MLQCQRSLDDSRGKSTGNPWFFVTRKVTPQKKERNVSPLNPEDP